NYENIRPLDGDGRKLDENLRRQVEVDIKYEGYIERQQQEVERFKNLEKIKIPPAFDYTKVHGLSNELTEKLLAIRPISLGQASRIPGMTPAAISVMMIFLKKAGALQ
ncbi:MAG TPA: tRNA uridine-5-carboxymethylaminomethyl(34) synthesis enzyme MnmG, partial [Desulfatiglandales bacterium]|nr:tRNA uridine-5-carboxymethylaminomethyl(34) synthesis enzyme MnmG [Desulfatiglandales bacterium]